MMLTRRRFASINYGRPLGINEGAYSVQMPGDVHESPIPLHADSQASNGSICYSPYQRELNRLYQVASPGIEILYAAVGDHHPKIAKAYYVLVKDVTKRLWRWRRELPAHLRMALDTDWPSQLSAADRAYKLQSLSLYLTFDSLLLILHRPFLKQRLDSVLASSPDQAFEHASALRSQLEYNLEADDSTSSGGGDRSREDISSHEHLWNAAVRTAKIAELPQLAQHATDGHLAMFVAINLFNASVVLVVMALSDPLADRSQEAKRAVARIYRILTALGNRSALSQQTSHVLRSLIQLLIDRESNAILAPGNCGLLFGTNRSNVSVRDALSQPLWMPHESEDEAMLHRPSQQPGTGRGLQYGLESVQRGKYWARDRLCVFLTLHSVQHKWP